MPRTPLPTSRRTFLRAAAALATAAAGPRLAFAAGAAADTPLLVHVHLRGGVDGLSLLVPRRGADRARYDAARPTLALAERDTLALDADLALHPALAPLLEVWDAGDLAVLPAVGAEHAPRDAVDALTRFAGGERGWLTRHLESAPERHDEITLPALALGRDTAVFEASAETLHTDALDALGAEFGEGSRAAVTALQGGDELGRQTAAALEIAAWLQGGDPARDDFPDTPLGRRLAAVAAVAGEGLGLRVAAVEMAGWDARGDLSARAAELADALHALWLAAARRGTRDRLVVVVESEAGRTLAETPNGEVRLGHAAPMLVLGGRVDGGVHGGWPGLATLSNGGLRPTVDRAAVLGHVLERHLGNAAIARRLEADAFTASPRLLR